MLTRSQLTKALRLESACRFPIRNVMAPRTSAEGPVPPITLREAESLARTTDFGRLARDIDGIAHEHETTSAIRNAEEETSRRLNAYGMPGL